MLNLVPEIVEAEVEAVGVMTHVGQWETVVPMFAPGVQLGVLQ